MVLIAFAINSKHILTDGIFFLLRIADLECKRRWTGLREKYRREKILNYKQRRLGQVVDLTQRWRNYMNMMFLDQVYTPRGYICMHYYYFFQKKKLHLQILM